MNLSELLLLVVVTCNYTKRYNFISAFIKPIPNSKYHFERGVIQRRYVVTKGENRHQPNEHQENRESYKIYGEKQGKVSGEQTKKRPLENYLKQKIRNCKDLKELLQLQRQEEINRFSISFYWAQVSAFMYTESECQKIRNNPEILRPIVKLTLDLSDKLNHPRSLAIMAHAIAKISFRTRNPIVESRELWKVLERNIVKAAKKERLDPKSCANILWAFAKKKSKIRSIVQYYGNSSIIKYRSIQFTGNNKYNMVVWKSKTCSPQTI